MSDVSEVLLGRNSQPILVGSVVQIFETAFSGCEGLVMDIASDMNPEDGPIAVFFDREVSEYKFHRLYDERWKGVPPTTENYRECTRVACFVPNDLVVLREFSDKTLAKRI